MLLVLTDNCLLRFRKNQQVMKKQLIITGLLFAAIMLVGSTVWAQWNTAGNTTWTNSNLEIRGDRAFMQDGRQVIRIHNGGHPTEFLNTYVGPYSGSNTEAQTTVGFSAGGLSTGEGQTAFGFYAGRENTGGGQLAFGREAGYGNSGEMNLAFGYQSSRFNTGHRILALGFQTGRDNSGDNCVFIGYGAGFENTDHNQFIIMHSIVNEQPLIKGDFATGELRIRGPLYADGKITTKEVEVTLDGWPDFVFDTDYELMSLHEVESFISLNKHLPGVPSEAEVKTNGVNLGEMSAVLLQKIEELTLHMISLNKQNEELRKKINELEHSIH